MVELFEEAGTPRGVLNFVTGLGNEIGEALSTHPDVQGVAFTGSYLVGSHIYREFSKVRPRPVVAEMGGKNPVIITRNADLDLAATGVVYRTPTAIGAAPKGEIPTIISKFGFIPFVKQSDNTFCKTVTT